MRWIPVEESLPVIPDGKYAVSVLVSSFDAVFEEINPGHGASTENATFMKNIPGYPEAEPDFQQMLLGGHKWKVSWAYPSDEITHWMYLPNPVQKGEQPNETNDSDCSCDCPGVSICGMRVEHER